MFARYEYKAGTTLANLIADVTAILTGTTDKATLSADCVQATTEIISTVAAGWVMHDAAAGTNKVCLKALNIDGGTYKYMTLDFNTANQLMILSYESWNASTHVGTNVTYTDSTNSLAIGISSGGTVFIFGSGRYALISTVSSTFVWSNLVGVIEYTRDDPWNTVANGYPAYGLFRANALAGCNPASGYSNLFNPPRTKDLTVDRLSGGAGLGYNTKLILSNYGPFYLTKLMDANGAAYIPLLTIQVSIQGGLPVTREVGMLGGSLLGIYLTVSGLGVSGDEVTYNSAQYFIHKQSGAAIALPKF